ncbi:hypothetical protein RISW2_23350 [Roseivivax isoporae LMG 25204]|uniref:NADH dehydrogenase subunit E n=2 Tax=Roseivivax TaxID=93682 RepID=X7F9K2_9RHOB|nr:hypothetical protein RISW2_23350 [Roseivivax isoporae LMG 25204]
MAFGAGALTTVLLLVLGGTGIVGSVFLGGVAFLFLGFLLSVVFCTPMTKPGDASLLKPGAGAGTRHGAQAGPAAHGHAAAATAPAQTAAPAPTPAPAPAAPAPAPAAAAPSSSATAAADAETGAKVKPSRELPGQADLSGRKGEWKYSGANGTANGSGAHDAAGRKPETLPAPRSGGADDLKKIKGIGPKLEEVCNSLGVYHFDQIASWSDEEIAWVDDNLEGFKGRVSRDNWVEQARALASGSGS